MVCRRSIQFHALVDIRRRSHPLLGRCLRRKFADGFAGNDWAETDLLRRERPCTSDELQIARTPQFIQPYAPSFFRGIIRSAVDYQLYEVSLRESVANLILNFCYYFL